MILGVSYLLGLELTLGVVGVGGKPEPGVCSGHRFKLEGTPVSGWAGVSVSLDLVAASYSRCWGRCCGLTCDPEYVLF